MSDKLKHWHDLVTQAAKFGLLPASMVARVRALSAERSPASLADFVRRLGLTEEQVGKLYVLDRMVPEHATEDEIRNILAIGEAGIARLAGEVVSTPVDPGRSDRGRPLEGSASPEGQVADRTVLLPDGRGTNAKLPKKLGPWVLLAELGHGAMGRVFQARHEHLGNLCALKILIPGEHATPEMIARFEREAKAMARLGRHPNLVSIHDLGDESGIHYYVMDLIPGKSLREVLGEGPLTPDNAAGVIEKIARALHVAHEMGFIHRDVKPANLIIGPDGEPHIMDFGLVRDFRTSSQHSDAGKILGTPAYMAPEQARGDLINTDRRTDVYALGAVLYEMLTGRPPHTASTLDELLALILRGKISSPRRVVKDVPADLAAICMNCLALDRSARYPSAEALADALARWRRRDLIPAPAAGRQRERVRGKRREEKPGAEEPRPLATSAHAITLPTPGAEQRPADAAPSRISTFSKEWTLSPTSAAMLDDLLGEVHGALVAIGHGESWTRKATQILKELADNALEHGAKQVDGGKVTVEIFANLQRARFVVTDDGPGFDPKSALALEEAGQPTDTRPRGRGLLLVKKLCSSLEFSASGNSVTATLERERLKVRVIQRPLNSTSSGNDLVIMKLEGSLDAHTYGILEEQINELLEAEDTRHLVLDLLTCAYISSSGMAVFVRCHHMVEERGGKFVLVVSEHTRDMLRMLGFAEVFLLASTVKEARELLHADPSTPLE